MPFGLIIFGLSLANSILAVLVALAAPGIALAVFNILCTLTILPPAVVYLVLVYRVLAGDELTAGVDKH